MTSHIKLYGSKGERFEQIKADMTKRLGYEPSNPELVGILMAHYADYSADMGPWAIEAR